MFEDRFIEVMLFMLNHTTFDLSDELDTGLLAMLEPLGIAPGQAYDPDTAPEIDGEALRAVAQRAAAEELANFSDQDWLDENLIKLLQPKGQIPPEVRRSSRSPGRSGRLPTRRSTRRSSPTMAAP